MLILSLVEDRARHGYEIGKLIEARSGGRLTFALPTLYPTLLRLENRGLIKGRWVEKAGERERCFYRDAIARGATDAEADAFAGGQIRDWTRMARDVALADRPHIRPRVDRVADRLETLTATHPQPGALRCSQTCSPTSATESASWSRPPASPSSRC
jgi:hypothetical protein